MYEVVLQIENIPFPQYFSPNKLRRRTTRLRLAQRDVRHLHLPYFGHIHKRPQKSSFGITKSALKNKKQFAKMTTPPYEENKFLNYPAVIKDTFPCQEKNYEKILAINRLFQAAVRFFRADRDDVADWRRFHLSTQRQ
ncbi:hypothetical protein OHJ28_02450 [Dickeya fangzhongdai]|uniref:hypothetical protein n=1 Tax=Dickeya fangzhongdai TaxID=1778540 RepID=UPI0033079001